MTHLVIREVSAGRMSVEDGADEIHRQLERARWRAFWTCFAALAVAFVVFFAVQAFAQAGDATGAAPVPVVTAPMQLVPVSAPASAVSGEAWLGLLFAVLAAGLGWYQRYLQAPVHAKLDQIRGAAPNPVVRTLAAVAEDLEPLIISAAGHVTHDVQTAADGTDVHQLATMAAGDLVDGLETTLKIEASKYFGSAGGGLVEFVVGAIKSKVQTATAAGASAAAAVQTTAQAAAAIDRATNG